MRTIWVNRVDEEPWDPDMSRAVTLVMLDSRSRMMRLPNIQERLRERRRGRLESNSLIHSCSSMAKRSPTKQWVRDRVDFRTQCRLRIKRNARARSLISASLIASAAECGLSTGLMCRMCYRNGFGDWNTPEPI